MGIFTTLNLFLFYFEVFIFKNLFLKKFINFRIYIYRNIMALFIRVIFYLKIIDLRILVNI